MPQIAHILLNLRINWCHNSPFLISYETTKTATTKKYTKSSLSTKTKKSLPYSKSSMLDGPSEMSLLEILGEHPL